ncbi:MAG: NADH-quinone oxidoreductase subunit NuoE [Candidatus Aminicenantes bacterium]|nr:NADH-quinone oxidoreductase subunit NuoE [Candidatus Aminicenantes bacterium]
MKAVFSADLRRRVEDLAAKYPSKSAALLPVLHLVQAESGFIGPDEEESVAALLGTTPLEVREVVTFYTMFRRKPVGRYHLQVCRNVSCSLLGGDAILDYVRKKLGLNVGETSADGRFTLNTVECLGACEQAPCLMVNFDHYGNLTENRVDEILGELA